MVTKKIDRACFTYNWDTDSYDLGNAYGHIAIEFDDIYKAAKTLKLLAVM